MITVGIYIKDNEGVFQRLEPFDDEKISVNSSVQNISDISKVFTDYSQSFTIPASKVNNTILKHWYENTIEDNFFDHRTKKEAFITLDTILFKRGYIQLEKATIKSGRPENYTISFIGTLSSLKQKFEGKMLKDLPFGNISYNPSDVADIIKGNNPNSDIKFPLISSDRAWNTDNTVPANNVTTPNGGINTRELLPAIRLTKIIDMIATTFGVTFNSVFFNTGSFRNAFLWLKNRDITEQYSEQVQLDFVGISSAVPNIDMNFVNNTFTIRKVTDDIRLYTSFKCRAVIIPSAPSEKMNLLVYKNNTLQTTIPLNNSNWNGTSAYIVELYNYNRSENENMLGEYRLEAQATSTMTFDSYLIFETTRFFAGPITSTTTPVNQLISFPDVGVVTLVPEIKLEDFFSGVLKMFNLTAYSEDGVNFYLEPLDNWYNKGKIYDITQYVIDDNIEIERVTPFKTIKFEYEKSQSYNNARFLANTSKPYGDLSSDTGVDGSEYTVKLPFENLLFTKDNNGFIAGYSVKTDFKSYIPKPTILYELGFSKGRVPSGFYIKNGGTDTLVTDYVVFGADTLVGGQDKLSLNFGEERSVFDGTLLTKSLFNQYYKTYVESIYNPRARQYKIKTKLPISLLTKIKLNDRLIIRSKRYIINNFTTDLTTGDSTFTLQFDTRDLLQPTLAVNDTYSFQVNTNNTSLMVLDNDITLYPTLTITSVNTTGFTLGTVTISVDKSYLHFTSGNATGTQSFTYTINDNNGQQSTATVTITITAVPSTLNANNDSFTLQNTGTQTLTVLQNDNLGITPTTITEIISEIFTLGTLSITTGGQSITFIPNGATGTDTFEYKITDSSNANDTATVTVTTTGTTVTYTPVNNLKESSPCGNYVTLYEGSDGLMYANNLGDLFTGTVYLYIGPSVDIFGDYDYFEKYYVNGVLDYNEVIVSGCGEF